MQWSELAAFHRSAPKSRYVLVTMVDKSGSSYRQPGARMLVRDDGIYCGGVSAGCLEEEVARAAKPVIEIGVARLLTIDTRPHYGCPGRITLLLEPLADEAAAGLFAAVEAHIRARKPFLVTTDFRNVSDGAHSTRVAPDEGETPARLDGNLVQRVGRAPRLVIVGEGEDASAVAKAAALARWEVHAVAPEEVQFAKGKLAARFHPDDRTAVVFLTHNLGLDVACVSEVLPLSYSYVGVIGSQKRRREIIEGLESAGCDQALSEIDNLHCPAGLDIGASDAGEIALSILAEIQCVWSGRDASPLRERSGPIHRSEQPA